MSESGVSREKFAAMWNDLEAFPTLRDIAQECGLTAKYVKNKANRIKKDFRSGKGEIELIDRSVPHGRPLVSELHYQFVESMTKDDLLNMLRNLQGEEVSKEITRNYFRETTGISDATWTRYFGSFLEFKRQAGLEMTRQQHQVQRQIAKHISVDHYRDFNTRSDLDQRYLKPSNSKIKTIIGCSDLHDIEIDPFYLRVLIEAVKVVQPDVVNFGGDIFDLAEFGKYGVDPREWDIVGKIKFAHDNIFSPIREALPNGQLDFVEGNHEYRLLRHLADATPALQAVLSDLLGLTVPQLLGLDEFEINYIAKGDLAAYNKGDMSKEVTRSYKIYDKALIVHHHPHAAKWGLPGWNGHHHHYKVDHYKNALRGAYKWSQLGCGHKTSATYCEGEFWDMGFMIAHINTETKTVTKEYISVTDLACVGGLFFYRQPDEMVGFYAERDKIAA